MSSRDVPSSCFQNVGQASEAEIKRVHEIIAIHEQRRERLKAAANLPKRSPDIVLSENPRISVNDLINYTFEYYRQIKAQESDNQF